MFTTLGVMACSIGATDRFSDRGIVPARDWDPLNVITTIKTTNLQLVADITIPLMSVGLRDTEQVKFVRTLAFNVTYRLISRTN
jgi:hypothetical protein